MEVLRAKVRLYEERIEKLEERVQELELERKERREIESVEGDREEVRSIYSVRSRNSSVGSLSSRGRISVCCGFSESEVGKIKKWVKEKAREGRKNNIIMRGIKIPKGVERNEKECKEWAEALIKEKIGVDIDGKVVNCRESGKIILIKLDNEEGKKEIMRNKYKLKGENLYIENNLSWEERKVQERIHRWTKEQKEKGVEVKAGTGRLRVKGMWKMWEEIEWKLEKEEEKRRMEKRRGEEELERNNKEESDQEFK
ncbi:golgin subfamily A member 6-like protein 1 [Solenopsis invicta]|uniref:golgin subfamily A member 6-like protein 1 n=1 Tax=Solenopsis invicta TaxID=13686 RepID=UPI00193D8D65|nr:golgin subfamily A member 6-like protein 1 [Solenopsis invicta]